MTDEQRLALIRAECAAVEKQRDDRAKASAAAEVAKAEAEDNYLRAEATRQHHARRIGDAQLALQNARRECLAADDAVKAAAVELEVAEETYGLMGLNPDHVLIAWRKNYLAEVRMRFAMKTVATAEAHFEAVRLEVEASVAVKPQQTKESQ